MSGRRIRRGCRWRSGGEARGNSMPSPLGRLLSQELPAIDTGVMSHGFADHGRDYCIILENPFSSPPGTFRLTFTHVVNLTIKTAVAPETWKASWDDAFTQYTAWEAAGEPNGYVFGTNWSGAYPGFRADDESSLAASWTSKLGKPMFSASLETDRFTLSLVYHDAQLARIADGAPTVSQTIVPLPEGWNVQE
jgi:hypothetical protein